MEAVYYLLPLSLMLAGAGLLAYWWASRSGQFDDLDTPAMRILFDEDGEKKPSPANPEDATAPLEEPGDDKRT